VEKATPAIADITQRRAIREQRRVHRSPDAIEAAVDDLDDDPFFEDEEKAIEALLKLIRKSRDRAADAGRRLRIAGAAD
jgi:thioredoxin-like negative regulator of GroEL